MIAGLLSSQRVDGVLAPSRTIQKARFVALRVPFCRAAESESRALIWRQT